MLIYWLSIGMGAGLTSQCICHHPSLQQSWAHMSVPLGLSDTLCLRPHWASHMQKPWIWETPSWHLCCSHPRCNGPSETTPRQCSLTTIFWQWRFLWRWWATMMMLEGVLKGIMTVLGFFNDCEGDPSALAMLSAGVSLATARACAAGLRLVGFWTTTYYESLNANLRLVLSAWVSKWNSDA